MASPSKDGKRKGKAEEEQEGKKRQRTSSRNTPDRTDDDDAAGALRQNILSDYTQYDMQEMLQTFDYFYQLHFCGC